MVSWPVVIKYSGQDELEYIENEQQWLIDSGRLLQSYTNEDELIDSNGGLYGFEADDNAKVVAIAQKSKHITLAEFEEVVKKHMLALNQCCSSKIKLSSFREGFELIKNISE